MSIYIAFYFSLFLLIALGVFSFVSIRRANKIARNLMDIDKREESTINNMRKCLDMAMQASNILAWTEDLHTNEIEIIYGSIKELSYDDDGSCISSIHHKDVDIYNNYRDRIVSGAKNEAPILIYIKKGAEYGYFECVLSLLYNENGEQSLLIGSLKDLTEINNLNETLNNLYNESQTIFQALPIGIGVYDKNGRQQYINEAVVKIFGINDKEAHIKKAINLFEDPMLPIELRNRIKTGEDFDKVLEYDLQIANDRNYFDTAWNHNIYINGRARSIKDCNGEIIKYILILDDITEKHRAELVLEDSERNLKLALDAGNVEAWSYDVKSKVFYSLGACCSFGENSLTLEDDNILIHPDDIKTKMDIMNDIILGKTDNGQAIIRYKPTNIQDKYHYYDTHMIAKKENDIVVAIAFAQKDITEKYLHEIEREYSQKITEFAINSAELALWEYDNTKQVFTLHNDAIIGLNTTDYLSVNEYSKYLNADEASDIEFRKIVSDMNEGIDKSYSIDIRINPKATDAYEWRHCTIGGSSFKKDENGRAIKYVGYIKDQTKWATLNDKLLNLNTQLQTVLDVGHIYPFICDIKGDKFRFRTTLEEEPILFIDLETELTWEQIQMVVHPEYREKMKSILMRLLNGEISTVCDEVRYCTDHIRNQIYEINMSIVRDEYFNGQITIIGYIQDITERKQMIYDLKKAKQEAEESVKVKAVFLANMSHEIRTPLNAIIGFSELLAYEEDEEKKAEFIGIISTNNDLLLKLINDVLDLSKIDAGFMEINASVFDFSQFFNELHLSMQQRITTDNVKLSIINPYSECIIELDKNRLAQICINYITNAIKYTPKGSIDMGYECINGGLRLYIKDTGIGIADDKKHKLFQRFEKFDDFAQGTGLGLSITKAIVESMKGKVGFESEKGSGSIFWAWIPCSTTLIQTVN